MVSSGSRIASEDVSVADETTRRQPMPIAQLFRRSANCKTVIDAHLTAFSLAEASIKLLSASAIVHFAEQPTHDPALVECLRKLARPSLGHWWEFARRLIPVLAERHASFAHVRSMLFERAHNDCPRAAGLDAAILTALGRKPSGGLTVRFKDVFDHIIEYRNKVLYHAAPAALATELHEQMAGAFQRGMGEILAKVDVLAGSQLIFVSDVRQSHGQWLVSRFDLTGENSRKQPPLELPRSATSMLPDGDRLYLQDSNGQLRSLHPFVVYDSEREEVLLLNSRRGSAKSEYLCYTSGRTEERADMGEEQRRLFADVLGMDITSAEVDEWAQATRIEEGAAPDEDENLAHRMLGEFELISELGRGGMGIVYRALQPSLGREVALKKLIRTSGGSEQRFLREIRALGRVEHQHLVKILTSGSVGEDWYYAMELIDGVPLSSVCSKLQHGGSAIADLDLSTWQAALTTACTDCRHKEKLLSSHVLPATGAHVRHAETIEAGELPTRVKAGRDYIERIVTLMRQVAGALEALHDENIIHRDVKPGNIMVSADGQRAMLMDLGLAQLADEEEGRLTRTRQFVGTLRYASPEQILAAERLSRRSDVYSLGATLWELLTLRPLFDADDNVNEAEIMRRIQLDEPDNVRQHNPRVDRDLDAIVMKCLEKKPDRRYATARELAEDLRRWYRGEPVLARRVTKLERSARWFLRRPALLSACAFGILAVVLGTGGGLAAWGYILSKRDVAVAKAAVTAAEAAELKATEASNQLAANVHELEDRTNQLQVEKEVAENAKRAAEAAEATTQAALESLATSNDQLSAKTEALEASRAAVDRALYANEILLSQSLREAGDVVRARDELQECRADLQGWEWRHLMSQIDGHRVAAESEFGQELSVAVDERGRRVAAARDDGKIRLLQTDVPLDEIDPQHPGIREVAVLEGPEVPVRSLALSADGRRLAALYLNNLLRVWDAETGRLLGDAPTQDVAFVKVAFSDAGNLLAVECDDKSVQIWQTSSLGVPTRQTVCRGHRDIVNALQFTADERTLATAGNDGLLMLWDARSGRNVSDFGTGRPDEGDGRLAISQLSVSRDGKWLATCESFGDVFLWGIREGRRCAKLVRPTTASQTDPAVYTAIVISPDGTRLAAIQTNTVNIWTLPPDLLSSGQGGNVLPEFIATATLEGNQKRIYAARYSVDNQFLATIGGDKIVDVWDASTGARLASLGGHRAGGKQIAVAPDGAGIVSVDENGGVFRWDMATGTTLDKHRVMLKGHTDRINQLEYSADGAHLATASSDGTARVWDTALGRQQQFVDIRKQQGGQLATSFEMVDRVAFNSDFTQLAVGTDVGRVQLWNPLDGTQIRELQGPPAHSGDFGLQGLARTIDFSADTMRLAIANSDGSIQLWDMQAGTPPLVLREHSGEINCLAFDRRGQRLVSAGADSQVCIWTTQLGQLERTFNGGGQPVHSAAFNPDGTLVAFGGRDRLVHLCNITSGDDQILVDKFGVSQSEGLGVLTLSFNRNGNRLAAAGDDNSVVLWDVPSGAFVTQLLGHTRVVRQITFSPNDSRVATAGADYTARIWDLKTLTQRKPVVLQDLKNSPPQYGHSDWVNMVLFSPDGKWVATASDDKTVQAWNAETGEHRQTFARHEDWIRAIAISPDGRRLVSACDDRRVRVWDVSRFQEEIAPEAPDTAPPAPDSAPPAPDAASTVTTLRTESASSGSEPIATYSGHDGIVRFVQFSSKNGSQVVSAVTGYSPAAHLWNAADGVKLSEFKGKTYIGSASLRDLKFSRQGGWIAANNSDSRSIRIWSAATGDEQAMIEDHPRDVTTFDFSPDGTLLASGSVDGMLRLFTVSTGQLLIALEGHTPQSGDFADAGGISHLAFSPDGARIATAGRDGKVCIWDVSGRKLEQTLVGHTDAVFYVAFNPKNAALLASSSADKTVLLWDVPTGKQRAVVKGHENDVLRCAFDPFSGSRLITAGADGTVRIWDSEYGLTLGKFEQFKGENPDAPLIAFRPDGKQLAVTAGDYVVHLLQTEETPAQQEERIAQWRRASVDAAQNAKNWTGMLFHLGYLLPEVDNEALLHYQHGIALAELERWQESRRALERTLELLTGFPDSLCTVYMRLGLVQLKCDDEPAFTNTLRLLVETAEQQRQNGNTNYSNDINAGWLAALRPGARVNYGKLIARVQEAVNSDETSVYWRETLGLLLYRSGQYDRAAVELQRAVEQSNGSDLEAQFILSLALHYRNQTPQGLAQYVDAMKKMGAWHDDVPPDARQPSVIPTSWEYREQRLWFQKEAEAVFSQEIAPDTPQS